MYNPTASELMKRIFQLNPELAMHLDSQEGRKQVEIQPIPEGWVQLKPGEEIKEGDAYFSTASKWESATVAIGYPVLDNGIQFIRRL